MSYPKLTPIIAKGATEPRYLEDRFSDAINVKDYGAKGDGTTNDTAAFEAAALTGKDVYIPAGTYSLQDDINGKFFCADDVSFTGGHAPVAGNGDLPALPIQLAKVSHLERQYERITKKSSLHPSFWRFSGVDVGTDYPNVKPDIDSNAWNAATQSAFVDSYDKVMYLAQMNAETKTMRLVAMQWSDNPEERILLGKTLYTYEGAGHQSNSLYRPSRYEEPFLFCPAHYYDNSTTTSNKNFVRVLKWDYANENSATEIYKLKLFDLSSYTPDNYLAATVSADSEYLIAEAKRNSDDQKRCMIWKVSNVLEYAKTATPDENGLIDISSLKLAEFDVHSQMTTTGQGIYSDGQYIYHLSGSTSPTITAMSFTGKFVENINIKNYEASEWASNTVTYEPEGLFWVQEFENFEPYLHISAVVDGVRRNRFFTLSRISSSGLFREYKDLSGYPCLVAFGRPSWEAGSIYDLWHLYHPRHRSQDNSFKTYVTFTLDRTNATIGQGNIISGFYIQFIEKGKSGGRFQFRTANSYDTSLDTVTTTSASFLFNITNLCSLGSANYSWANVYVGSPAVDLSDERLKANIDTPKEALMRAWGKVNFKVFQFKDAIQKKGVDARLHVGLIAQEVQEAFKSEGLDASRYGLFCYDEWQDEYEEQEDGTQKKIQEAGNVYGIRYEEALALECAYQRWRLEQLEERINQLTNSNN